MEIQLKIGSTEPKASVAKNYILVVDCSYSMYYDLQKLREQLKNKLPSMIEAEDKLSIIYFSSRGDCGYIYQDYQITSPTHLTNVKNAIDKFLKPIGATAFADPLKLAVSSIDENFLNILMFQTDGYNNDSTKADVLEAAKGLTQFDSVNIIKYGNYCDDKLLAEIGNECGAAISTANGFEELVIKIEEVQGLQVTNGKIEVEITDSDVNPFYVGLGDNMKPTIYKVTDGKIFVNGDTLAVFGINDSVTDESNFPYKKQLALIYANMMLGNPERVEEILCNFGDSFLIQLFEKAYGKQKLNEFLQTVEDVLIGKLPIFSTGQVFNYQPKTDGITVIDVLYQLTSIGDDGVANLFYPNSDYFNYSSIGAKKVAKVKELSEEEKQAIILASDMSKLEETLDGLNNQVVPKFEIDNVNEGVPLTSLVFNSKRANVSVNVTTKGTVSNFPKNEFGITSYPSCISRTYTIIKDGILNVTELPVKLNKQTEQYCIENGLISDMVKIGDETVCMIQLDNLGIINKSMISKLNSVDFATKCFELKKLQAKAKVFKAENNEVNPYKMADVSPEVEEFLKTCGVTKNGFNPPVTTVKGNDVYFAPQLEVKFKGLSSLPKIEDVETKLAAGKKLTLSDTLISEGLATVEKLQTVSPDPEFLDKATKAIIVNKRKVEFEIAKDVMAVILSRGGWFTDRDGVEDNVIFMDLGEADVYKNIQVTFDYKDISVSL